MYLGNTLQAAYSSYLLIDSLSASFNGTTTSFALKVNGVAPVPFPLNEQNVLISVGGVPQKPDPTGAEGFKFSGTNIVFSSAPKTGEAFWGVVLAGADYVNVGVSYPDGAAATPSITFNSNKTTGIYLAGVSTLGFTTAGVLRSTIDSNGNFSVLSAGSATIPAVAVGTGTTYAPGIYSPGADQVAIATGGTGRVFVTSGGLVGVGATPTAKLESNYTSANPSLSSNAGVGLSLKGNSFVNLDFGTYTTSPYASWLQASNGAATAFPIVLNPLGGNVGIGTSSPSELLTVAGNIRANGTNVKIGAYGANSSSPQFILGNSSGTDHYIIYETIDGSGNRGSLNIYDGVAASNRITVNSSGNVGIGTTSPGNRVHVVQTKNTTGIFLALDFAGSPTAGDYSELGFGTTGTHAAIRQAYNNPNAGAASSLRFFTNNNSATNEVGQFDSSGRLLVGTSSARNNYYNSTAFNGLLNIEGYGANTNRIVSFVYGSSDAGGAIAVLGKTRSASSVGNTAVINADELGTLAFQGADGTNLVAGATISALVDGTPGTGSMPGRLVFSTTPSGSASSTERMRITSDGLFKVGANVVATGSHELYWKGAARFRLINADTTAANCYGININYPSGAPNGIGNEFIYCDDSGGSRLVVRSNGGIANYSANNVNLSDINAKKDIALAAGTWDCLKDWEIVNFRYKDQPDDADLNMGVIAQQVAESCPEVITVYQAAKEATDDKPAQEERLGVKDQQMMWMAIKALQEAQLRIETLETEVAALKGA